MNKNEKFKQLIDEVIRGSNYIREYDKIPRNYGTSEIFYMAECHTIELVYNYPEITITEIAEMTGKTKAAVSKIISKMEKKECIKKEINSENKKSFKLTLTEKGISIYKNHLDFDRQNYEKILEKLDEIKDEELEIFIKIQKKLNNCFKSNIG